MLILNLPFLSVALFVGVACAAPPTAAWFPKAPPLTEPTGNVFRVANVEELHRAIKKVEPGGTISLADGFYRMERYIEITADNVDSLRTTWVYQLKQTGVCETSPIIADTT